MQLQCCSTQPKRSESTRISGNTCVAMKDLQGRAHYLLDSTKVMEGITLQYSEAEQLEPWRVN